MTSRILIVDDNEANRDLLLRRVRRGGYEATAVADGSKALERLAKEPFDLVLLDVMMPGMTGYEVLEAIKSDETLSRIRVIMVSALDEIDSVVRCIDLGADDYLPKPFNPTLLAARIASSLDRKTADDLIRREAERMERDLEIGREIQAGFFPNEIPQPPGWEVAVQFQAAREVGGDFYDVFMLPDGRLGFLIADVCDKGVGAALYMALFRTLLRSQLTTLGASLPKAVAWVSDYIAMNHGDSNMFATVFAAAADLTTGKVSYVNAGHNPPLILRRGEIAEIGPTATAVGLLPGLEFPAGTETLQPGETLLAFTDGITEATRADLEQFGDGRLHNAIAYTSGRPADLIAALDEEVRAFVGDEPQFDDMTMLSVGRIG